MGDFLNQVYWGNTVKAYCIVLGVVLFVFLLKRYISKYIAGLLCKLMHRMGMKVDRAAFVSLVVQPLGLFLFILTIIIALEKLHYPPQLDFELYHIKSQQIIESFSAGILVVAFIWLLLRIIDFVAFVMEQRANRTPDHSDNQLIVFFKDFFKVMLVIVGFLLVLKFSFHFDIGSLLTGLSIVGAAIALATRESLENLIASFIIFFDKPFTTGDLVKVQQVTGTVEKIGLRSTRIRTEQKTYVTVPNKQMVDSILDNHSLRTQRKAATLLEIESKTSREQITRLISGIKEKISEYPQIEEHTVFLKDIQHQAFIVEAEFFTEPIEVSAFNELKQEINIGIITLLEELDIKLTSAYRPVTG
jgi:MscS family membrane protein